MHSAAPTAKSPTPPLLTFVSSAQVGKLQEGVKIAEVIHKLEIV